MFWETDLEQVIIILIAEANQKKFESAGITIREYLLFSSIHDTDRVDGGREAIHRGDSRESDFPR